MDPKLCYVTEKGNKILRHFSQASRIFIEHQHQLVFDCGTCFICRKKKAYELACRCVLHASLYLHNCFITLTYDEKKDGYHNQFDYTDIQKFKKRLRSQVWREQKKRIEVFNVHEYGKNGKKHWHLIVFNHDFADKVLYTNKNGVPLYTSKNLEHLWPYGYNTVGDVSEASAMYQAQYMEKDAKNGNLKSKKQSHSKHAGIGKPFFLKHYSQILRLGFVPIGGRKLPVPRYFEKLADKHYCHFYDQTAFFDSKFRKKKHNPFKQGQENKEIADLYLDYKTRKLDMVQELEKEWREVISQYLVDEDPPDFVKSAQNQLYDLRNKTNKENF